MASLHIKPYILLLPILCRAAFYCTRGLPMRWSGGLLVGKRAQEVWEKQRKKGKIIIIIIINKKLTSKINMKKRGEKNIYK